MCWRTTACGAGGPTSVRPPIKVVDNSCGPSGVVICATGSQPRNRLGLLDVDVQHDQRHVRGGTARHRHKVAVVGAM
ncbi:hypothetical protein LZG04_23730 [Saccharothrix sp. S26]|uniref:hypothetical protein n=1 Tax=Saccharothrix sp. S26 TaxID=2907215 RepID=UPI001F41FED1|nr:hypothetical protein [Saccharothrix sp. S26]MCE6997786.1 hypothetical protein [Saccharothrix sp. S26]